MFKRVKFLIASIFAVLLWATPVSALSSTELEQISDPSDSIEINEPAEGYNFDATFLSKGQELQFETTVTNDAEKDITVNDVVLNESSYDFFDYSFSGLRNDDIIKAGESKKLVLTVRTNNNDTQTVSEDYRLSIAYTENEEEFDNPETAAIKIVPVVAAITFASLAIFVLFTKSAKRRFFVIALAVPALGVFLLTQNTIAKESENFDILGNIHFINSYTVTVDPDGGIYDNAEEPSETIVREGEIFHVNEATRNTYTFERWEVNPGQLDSNSNIEIHSDTLIRAIWNENHYNLTINPNGGSYKGVSETSTFTYREGKVVDIETPIRNTYKFTGWTIEPNTTFDGSITMDKDYTLTANWEEIYYTLTIDPRGGIHDGHTEAYEQSIRAGNKVCLNSPERDTYNFTGWLSDQAGLDGNSCFRMEQDTTFIATWDEVFYKLTINPNGGKYGENTNTFSQNRRANTQVCLDMPVRETYRFTGWTSNDIALDAQSCFIIEKDSEFTANWEEIYYTLSINLNGGNYSGETTVADTTHRAGTTVPIVTPEYAGHEFKGWTRNETESFNNDSIVMNENIALVANWDDIYFDVTINPNGGKYNNLESVWSGKVKYGDSVDLSGTTWTDHEITHWTQNNDEIASDSTTIEIYEDTDFVAYWQSTIFHTVTIIPNGGIYDESTVPKEYSVRQGTEFPLVKATREDDGFAFESWYLGETVNPDKKFPTGNFVVEQDTTLIANWFKIVARIERTGEVYPSIMAAHEEANPGNITKDIITLLVDTEEIVTNTKEVTLDLNSHTVSGYINNTTNGNLTLINGEINNYEEPIVDTVNPNGAAVVNNGILTMGKDNYLEDDDNHKEPIIENENIRLIGTEVGLQQNNTFYFYDGYIEGILGLVGGYDGSPWYRDTFDGVVIHYFPFVTHNNTKDCQHVELSNADKAVSKTTIHGDIYYYNLQDNINTSSMTGFQIYAVRDFDASYTITVPADGEDIVFDITGYEVNIGDNFAINGKLTIKDSKTGDEAGLLTSSKTIVNNNTLDLQNVKVSALTANTLLKNSGTLNATNSTLQSDKGIVVNVTGDNAVINMDNDSYIKSSSNAAAISNNSTGLTIVSGNIEGKECTIRNYNNTNALTITGGNVFAPYRAICNEGGTVNISGGTISSERESSPETIYTNYGTVNISGGTISATGTYYTTAIYSNSGTIEVTGGNISATANGYDRAIVLSGNYGTITIDGKDAKLTATNNGTGSASIYDRYASTINVKQGTLTAEANSGDSIIMAGTANSFNISGGTMTSHSKSGNAYGISSLWSNSSTTANISGGSISATTDNADKLGIGVMTNIVNATDGYIYGSTYGIEGYNSGYTSTTTLGKNEAPLYNGQDGVEAKPVVKGGVYAIDNGYILFYDGILKGGVEYINNPANIRAIPDGTNYNIVNLEDPAEQDCWLVVDSKYLHLESNGKDYNSLSKAFEDAEETDLITVTEDKTTAAVITTNEKNITIDLDGHNITYTQPINNTGTLTLKDNKSTGTLKNTNSRVRVIDNNGIFNLQSGSITGNECSIQNHESKTLNISGGSISSWYRPICNDRGTVNISGGNVSATRTDSTDAIQSNYGTINISGGNISATGSHPNGNWIYINTIYQYGGETKITGGTLSSTNTSNGYAYVFADSYGTITIGDEETEKDEDIVITATTTNNGTAIIHNKYGSNFNVIKGTLIAESNKDQAMIASSGCSTYNISGGSMTSHSQNGDAFGFNSLGNCGTTANISGGSISATTDNTDKLGIGVMANTVNITDGTVYGSSHGIYGENSGYYSTVTIGKNDGTIYNGQAGVAAKPIIRGGTYGAAQGNVYFYDGLLKGGIDGYYDRNIKGIADQSYMHQTTETIDDKEYVVKYLATEEDLAKIGSGDCETNENTTCYPSIQAAINAANAGDTIELLKDNYVFNSIKVPADKTVTVDTKGFNIITGALIENYGNLTIINSEKANSNPVIDYRENNRFILNKTGATLRIDDIKLKSSQNTIENESGAVVTLNRVNIDSANYAVSGHGTMNIADSVIYGHYAAIRNDNGKTNVTGSTLTSYVNAVYLYSYNNENTATFKNTTITDLNDADHSGNNIFFIQSNNVLSVTIDGCTLNGWLVNYDSNVTVKDSTINRVESYNYPAITNSNGTLILDNTKVNLTSKRQSWGYSTTIVLDNSGTATLKNNTQLELLFDMYEWYSVSGEARIINNSGTVNLDNAKLINTSFKFAREGDKDTARTYGIYNTGTVNYTNSTIELTRYESFGIYNESGNTQINSGSIKAGGYKARGVWIKNGSLTMGEAEPTDSADYGKATAHVSTTDPYIEALGSNSGIGVTLETGSFNFFDGKILQTYEVGPAVQENGIDKATVTEVEYLYQPEKHQDENGNYYFVLEFMR